MIYVAMTVPPQYKLHNGITKYIFKKFAAQLLPPELLAKTKHGFSVPLKHWFRKELRPFLGDTLLTSNAQYRDFLDPSSVATLVHQHWQGKVDHSALLWALLSLEVWLEESRNQKRKTLQPSANLDA